MLDQEQYLKILESLGISPAPNAYQEKVAPLNANQNPLNPGEKLRPEDEQRMLKLRALDLMRSKTGE